MAETIFWLALGFVAIELAFLGYQYLQLRQDEREFEQSRHHF